MARRKTNRRRSPVRHHRRARAHNPAPRRRRRSVRRRRHNPVVARRRSNARLANPRRHRRHHRRRSNPSAMRIGEILKDMIYGAGGAVLTRVGAGAVRGFIPASFSGQAYTEPLLQGAVAVLGVRLLGKKFLGQKQGDLMMLGGLISAGLAAFDSYLPNVQSQLSNIIRFPVAAAPQAALPAVAAVQGSGLGDVYDVDLTAAGFGDVEEVPMGIWG